MLRELPLEIFGPLNAKRRRVGDLRKGNPNMMAGMGAQTGRPSKGERDAILAKPAKDFGKLLKANADALGYDSYGDYLVDLAAEALGMPEYKPKRSKPAATQNPIAELDIQGLTRGEGAATRAA